MSAPDGKNRLAFATRTIHAGQSHDPTTGAVMTPIYATSTYAQQSPGVHKGFEYARSQNPTRFAFERCIADLEGGTQAFAFASGLAAGATVIDLLNAGDHVIASDDIYGGSFRLFERVKRRTSGLEFSFVDLSDLAAVEAAVRPNTRMIWVETPTNPTLKLVDLAAVAAIAKAHGLISVADNTFASPYVQRPLEHGFDIVTHSTTKYLDGHDVGVGGAIIDSGNFDWMAHADKFPGLCTPDESYHGITYAEKFGQGGAFITKCTAQLMRDFGSIQSPQNAFYLNLGIESLAVRMERHCANAQKVAEFLQQHENVAWVTYPGLPGDKYYDLAQKYMPNGTCGVISFGVKGGRKAAEDFMKKLKIGMIATHVADAHTCVLHPASSTHRQLTDEELIAAGVAPDLIRLSVGIENVDDIIEDLEQALKG